MTGVKEKICIENKFQNEYCLMCWEFVHMCDIWFEKTLDKRESCYPQYFCSMGLENCCIPFWHAAVHVQEEDVTRDAPGDAPLP